MTLEIGKLGDLPLKRGYYIYVGSAMGSGGLKARVARHLRTTKKFHWHIDYLLEAGKVRKVFVLPTTEKQECRAASHLMKELEVVKGFSSSDCNCPGHLFFSPNQKNAEWVVRSLSPNILRYQIQ